MKRNIYGYVRVSSKDQCEDRQLLALKEFGIVERNIYTDKISGKNFNRPQYHRLMKKLKQGDVVVLDMPLLDTRKSQNNDLTGTFIADLVLQILAYVAQIERENIKQRQKEGIHAAKCRGVQFGRPRKNIPDNFDDVKGKWEKSEINSRQAAQILGISQNTFLRWSHE